MNVTFLRPVLSFRDGPGSAPREIPRISFEITDLFYYYATGNTPTGIQRVQQELCFQISTEDGYYTELVIYDRSVQTWRKVPVAWAQSMLALAREYRAVSGSWSTAYEDFAVQLTRFPQKRFEPGEWLVNVGASWSLPSYFAQVRQLRGRGVRVAVFLHDCISLRHPAYFDKFHSVEYSHWLAQVRESADLVICNSETTRKDYLSLVRPPESQKVQVCRLDAAWDESESPSETEEYVTEFLDSLGVEQDDFVLCVGTVEPRKNHLSLIHVWDRLRQTHPVDCPKLLCVGRIGWKSEAVLAQAKALGQLGSKIYFLGSVSDDLLRGLYRRCLFSVYPSYYEGWGLPVTESLAAGKVCVAGSHSSLVEAGAGFAIHVDERSETSIHEAISRLIDSPEVLREANDRICAGYLCRSWAQIFSEITEFVAEAAAGDCLRPAFPILRMNVLHKFGRAEAIRNFENAEMGEVFCIGNAWHAPEAWGVWTNKPASELAFLVNSDDRSCTVFLALSSPPGGGAVKVHLNGKLVLSLNSFVGKKIVRVPLESAVPDSSGGSEFTPVTLRLVSDRVQQMREVADAGDERVLGIGYLYLIAFQRTSLFERLEFLEQVVTGNI